MAAEAPNVVSLPGTCLVPILSDTFSASPGHGEREREREREGERERRAIFLLFLAMLIMSTRRIASHGKEQRRS